MHGEDLELIVLQGTMGNNGMLRKFNMYREGLAYLLLKKKNRL